MKGIISTFETLPSIVYRALLTSPSKNCAGHYWRGGPHAPGHRVWRDAGGIVRGHQSRRCPWRWCRLQCGSPGTPSVRTGRGLPAAQPVPSRASSARESHRPTARLSPHSSPAGHSRTAVKVPDTRRPGTRPPSEARLGGRLTSARDTRLLRAGAFAGTVPHGVCRSPLRGGAAV